MGRQAHITRLALGRSPYGEPLRDERGEFIIGPHAHDNDAPGYVQQFDDRGHPQNRASRTAARRLRKAQNDVLATVGVVVKKNQERKSRWERMDDGEKKILVRQENRRGHSAMIIDRTSGFFLSWYIASLRKRLMTFSSYSTITFVDTFTKEYRALGLASLLWAGLPLGLCSDLLRLSRRFPAELSVDEFVNYADLHRTENDITSMTDRIKSYPVKAFALCLELPLLVYSTLKSLYIIPMNTGINWRFLIPFSATSPVCLPPLPHTIDTGTVIHYVLQLTKSPLVLYLIHDRLAFELRLRLYALFRQVLTKPDRPDTISAFVFDEREELFDISIAGMGLPYRFSDGTESGERFFGPKSFFGALRTAFPPIYKLLNLISGGKLGQSRGRLSASSEELLQKAIIEEYWGRRNGLEDRPLRGSRDDGVLRDISVGVIFGRANLTPNEELVDHVAWTDFVLGARAESYHDRMQIRARSHYSMESINFVHSLQEALHELHLDDTSRSVLAEALQMVLTADVAINTRDGSLVLVVLRRPPQPSQNSDQDDLLTLDAPEVTVDMLLERARSLEQAVENTSMTMQTEEQSRTQPVSAVPGEEVWDETQPDVNGNEEHPDPPTPTQGLSRAASLAALTNVNLRPRRRPTETDDSLAAISQTLRAEAENLPSPRPAQVEEDDWSPLTGRYPEASIGRIVSHHSVNQIIPLKYRFYRVTSLSNHLADSLAWHSSSLLTSLILWPLEAVWLRAVADWALWNPAIGEFIDPWWAARLEFGVVGRPIHVLGLGTWFGGADGVTGKLRYMGSIMLTLGLEGMLRGACWAVGAWYVRYWKKRYGWGQF